MRFEALASLVVLAAPACMPHAFAAEYVTFAEALALAFPGGGAAQKLVTTSEPPGDASASLGGVYVACDAAGALEAVLIIDNVIGRTEFITYACILAPDGAVRRLEVMAYREPVGGEVRHRRFLDQFAGKRVGDRLRPGRDVANVAGATLSVNALAGRVATMLGWWRDGLSGDVQRWQAARGAAGAVAAGVVERAAAIGSSSLTVRLRGGDAGAQERLGAAAEAALTRARALDAILNSWRDDSELATLNRLGEAALSPELDAALGEAGALWSATGGRFDPTVGPLLVVWRDAAAAGRRPDPAELAAARARIGFGRVQLGAGRAQLDGAALDLGGINKGHILDQCARTISALLQPGDGGVIGYGASSWIALGEPGDLAEITLRHPSDPARGAWRIRLRPGQALGTSAAAGQTFVVGDERLSHLIDPLTGEPAPLDRAAVVLAPSAAEADGLDNTLCLLPPAEALALVAARPGVEAAVWDGARWQVSAGWTGSEIPAPE